MYLGLFLAVLPATILATPFAQPLRNLNALKRSDWQPAPGTVVTCNKASDKTIGFYQGPQMETVLNDACAAMMPPCAYQDRLPKDTVCVQTIDFALEGPVKSVQAANVQDSTGNKISGWLVQFAVTPGTPPAGFAQVQWQRADCYGYFAQMLSKWAPEGCHTDAGFGVGTTVVGGDSSLKGTTFEVTFVKRS